MYSGGRRQVWTKSENLSDLNKKDRNKRHSSPFINVVIKFICTRCETGLKSSPKARYSTCTCTHKLYIYRQCTYIVYLWLGTITNIPVNGSQFSKSLQNTNKLGHVFSTQNGYMLSWNLWKLFIVIWWKFFHSDIVFILWFQYITLYCIILVDGLNGGTTQLWCKESIHLI
jgi:hypothetical protein